MIERIPTVGIVVLFQNNVLLVEHLDGAGHVTGSFGTPGGRVDQGETVEDAAVRELKEEAGVTVNIHDLIRIPKVYDADLPRKNGEVLSVSHTVFAANKFSGELRDSEETKPQWIPFTDVSKLNLLINTEDMIQHAQKAILAKPE